MPATTKAAKKSTKSANSAKKGAKKSTKKAPKRAASVSNVEYGAEKSRDVPWNDKKVAVFKALKRLKAVGQGRAKGTNEIAEVAEVSSRDVRHYCYHAKVSGLTGMSVVEGSRGYGFYLTAKGSKTDPVKALKAQEAAKAK